MNGMSFFVPGISVFDYIRRVMHGRLMYILQSKSVSYRGLNLDSVMEFEFEFEFVGEREVVCLEIQLQWSL